MAASSAKLRTRPTPALACHASHAAAGVRLTGCELLRTPISRLSMHLLDYFATAGCTVRRRDEAVLPTNCHSVLNIFPPG